MFCKYCGHQNPDTANYCINDGQQLKEISDSNILFIKDEIKFCSHCGNTNDKSALYCSKCGNSILKADYSAKSKTDLTSSNKADLSIVNINARNLKSSVVGVAISLSILIILSLIVKLAASNYVDSMLGEFIDSVALTDYIMFFNLVTLNINSSWLSVLIHLGFYLLLLIPLISLFVGSFISAKINKGLTLSERIYTAVLTGILYAIFIGLISVIAGISESEDIQKNYSFASAIFNGFILGTFFSLFGLLFEMGGKQITGHLRGIIYGESIHQAISTVARGFIICLLIGIISYFIQGDSELIDMLVQLQGAFYVWVMLHLPSLNIVETGFFEEKHSSTSIFQIIGQRGEVGGIYNINLFLVVIMFVGFILIMFWAGRKIKQLGSGSFITELAVFSLSYGLIMGILAGLLGIKAGILETTFNSITTFILAAVVAFIVSFIGYKITEMKETKFN